MRYHDTVDSGPEETLGEYVFCPLFAGHKPI
jgi:hypothetical protein